MQSESFLDVLIARFKDRWETNPQYRAAMSGVLGLLTLIAICTCTGIISTVASSVLLASGFGPTSNANPQSGGGGLAQGAAVFPIVTPKLPGAVDTPPAHPAPLSQTPEPTATAVPTPTPPPTATPCAPNCGGGGGGYSVTVSITAYGSTGKPNQWVQCSGTNCDYVTVHTTVPNTYINVIVTTCTGATVLSNPNPVPTSMTDANGDYTLSFNQPAPSSAGAKVWVTAAGGDPNGATIYPKCG